MSLSEVLRENIWRELHPATKLIVKILQHIRSKIKDGAEVRAYFDNNEILVTTYKSEIWITPTRLEFKRRTRSSLRVQRIKTKELDAEVLNTIKNAIVDILEHDYEPNYQLIVESLEKALKPD
jgi:hypothetical protein